MLCLTLPVIQRNLRMVEINIIIIIIINQKPQRCVSFAPKFPPFIAACSAASRTFNEKSFTQRVFLAKNVKNISEMEWNSFVCFTVDKENGREPAKQQRKGKNRTRRKLLCFLSELLCLSLKLKLILKPA